MRETLSSWSQTERAGCVQGIASAFTAVAKALYENEETIVSELAEVQGQAVDIAGYYRPDEAKTSAVVRPSATLNMAMELLTK
ncbi:NADP-dependent isocitrate dehydrogenase [Glutamicibacter arilaitensis]|uniref:NADP-dependent isocitrate dehydrogenase n=1 Tax=Glutamicibacter arilaitensis TaxID=256701 RepID=UPI003F909F2D